MSWIVLFVSLVSYILRVEAVQCNATQACPEELPCCSQYGECGTGINCLGGCNPMFSFKPQACMPMPVCKDLTTTFNGYASNIVSHDDYLGNSSEADWLYSGYVVDFDDDESMLLAMPKNSGGTVLSSTSYLWYGKVSAKLKSSHLGGVVTAFIVFSNIQDEIDYEWIGADLETVQTNYYFEGLLNYNNSKNITTSDTFDEYHDYEIDWHEDYITWSVDGVVGRTLLKNDTYNSTSERYEFPQTPSRVQLSIWPGGNSTNAPGTIAWAGGLIDWDASDIKDPGYYFATLKEVNVTCYDPPSFAIENGTTAYTYTKDDSFLAEDIAITDDDTFLYSSKGSGLKPDEGKKKSSSSASSSTSTKSSSSSASTSSSSGSSSTSSSSSSSSESSSSSSSSESTTESSDGASTSSSQQDSETSVTGDSVQTTANGAQATTTSLTPEQSTGFVQNIKSSTSSTGSKSQSVSTETNGAVALSLGLPIAGLFFGYLL